jgi:hypothetical protein
MPTIFNSKESAPVVHATDDDIRDNRLPSRTDDYDYDFDGDDEPDVNHSYMEGSEDEKSEDDNRMEDSDGEDADGDLEESVYDVNDDDDEMTDSDGEDANGDLEESVYDVNDDDDEMTDSDGEDADGDLEESVYDVNDDEMTDSDGEDADGDLEESVYDVNDDDDDEMTDSDGEDADGDLEESVYDVNDDDEMTDSDGEDGEDEYQIKESERDDNDCVYHDHQIDDLESEDSQDDDSQKEESKRDDNDYVHHDYPMDDSEGEDGEDDDHYHYHDHDHDHDSGEEVKKEDDEDDESGEVVKKEDEDDEIGSPCTVHYHDDEDEDGGEDDESELPHTVHYHNDDDEDDGDGDNDKVCFDADKNASQGDWPLIINADKSAVVTFVRQGDPTAVVATAPDRVAVHPGDSTGVVAPSADPQGPPKLAVENENPELDIIAIAASRMKTIRLKPNIRHLPNAHVHEIRPRSGTEIEGYTSLAAIEMKNRNGLTHLSVEGATLAEPAPPAALAQTASLKRSPILGEPVQKNIISVSTFAAPEREQTQDQENVQERKMPLPVKKVQVLDNGNAVSACAITDQMEHMFPKNKAMSLPCHSARIFACFTLRLVDENLSQQTQTGSEGRESRHRRSAKHVEPLLPLLSALVTVEQMSLVTNTGSANVSFSGFDCSSTEPPVGSLWGSQSRVEAIIEALGHAVGEFHRLRSSVEKRAEVISCLDSIILFLKEMESSEGTLMRDECSKVRTVRTVRKVRIIQYKYIVSLTLLYE